MPSMIFAQPVGSAAGEVVDVVELVDVVGLGELVDMVARVARGGAAKRMPGFAAVAVASAVVSPAAVNSAAVDFGVVDSAVVDSLSVRAHDWSRRQFAASAPITPLIGSTPITPTMTKKPVMTHHRISRGPGALIFCTLPASHAGTQVHGARTLFAKRLLAFPSSTF